MEQKDRLVDKQVLIVDDEVDILDSLEALLFMCDVSRASSFQEAERLLKNQHFDIAILDIMGVDGYSLLEIANARNVMAVMLTANALSPKEVVRSYERGAAFYIPKEGITNIATFLNDILEAKEKGKNLWSRWLERWATYFEKKFGADWKKENKDFWERFPSI